MQITVMNITIHMNINNRLHIMIAFISHRLKHQDQIIRF